MRGNDRERAVKADHELGDTVVASLHVLATSVEGRQEDLVTDGVPQFRTTMGVGGEGLMGFGKEEIVLCFECVRLDASDERGGALAVPTKI